METRGFQHSVMLRDRLEISNRRGGSESDRSESYDDVQGEIREFCRTVFRVGTKPEMAREK